MRLKTFVYYLIINFTARVSDHMLGNGRSPGATYTVAYIFKIFLNGQKQVKINKSIYGSVFTNGNFLSLRGNCRANLEQKITLETELA